MRGIKTPHRIDILANLYLKMDAQDFIIFSETTFEQIIETYNFFVKMIQRIKKINKDKQLDFSRLKLSFAEQNLIPSLLETISNENSIVISKTISKFENDLVKMKNISPNFETYHQQIVKQLKILVTSKQSLSLSSIDFNQDWKQIITIIAKHITKDSTNEITYNEVNIEIDSFSSIDAVDLNNNIEKSQNEFINIEDQIDIQGKSDIVPLSPNNIIEMIKENEELSEMDENKIYKLICKIFLNNNTLPSIMIFENKNLDIVKVKPCPIKSDKQKIVSIDRSKFPPDCQNNLMSYLHFKYYLNIN